MKIPLSQNLFAVIDDGDFDKISAYKWYAHKCRSTFYAIANVNVGHAEVCKSYNGRTYAPRQKRSSIKMHRLIMNAPSKILVDHRDGDGLNNTRDNLRMATNGQNIANSRKKKKGSSLYKGVRWNTKAEKWDARIQKDKKSFYLGLFLEEKDAAKAYDAAAIKYFGPFARINFN